MPLKRRAKATRAANWRRMAAWTSGGSWLLESKHDIISSGTDDGSSPAIRSEDPASRGGAPDSLSVSSLNIRLAHTERAFVLPGLLALTGMASLAAAQATHATVPEPLPDGCVIDHLLADDSAEYDTRATGPATVVDLSITGPSANRIDIVFIGDDYTEDTLDDFAARNGRVRRASVATICWCLRKWPIRPTRASSSFTRKRSRRRSSSAAPIGERWADPRRSPILR